MCEIRQIKFNIPKIATVIISLLFINELYIILRLKVKSYFTPLRIYETTQRLYRL